MFKKCIVSGRVRPMSIDDTRDELLTVRTILGAEWLRSLPSGSTLEVTSPHHLIVNE